MTGLRCPSMLPYSNRNLGSDEIGVRYRAVTKTDELLGEDVIR